MSAYERNAGNNSNYIHFDQGDTVCDCNPHKPDEDGSGYCIICDRVIVPIPPENQPGA